MDISIDKNIRAELFQDYIALDSEKVILNGQEYNARLTQPTDRRVMQVSGLRNEVLDFECMIYIPDNEQKPKSGGILTRVSDGSKYRILPDVRYDFGNACYTIQLTKKN